MALTFDEHDDVVFGRAPLTVVLCQIRFPRILSLHDEAGVAGFQEALRAEYPELSEGAEAEFVVSPQSAEVKVKPRVWRLRTADAHWTVSLGINFVALETNSYEHFKDFADRLDVVLGALDRTVHPGRSTRIGLRKVNAFEHPEVDSPATWNGLLKADLLGLAGNRDVPGSINHDYSEFLLADDDGHSLTIRHGIDPEDCAKYRLDLDYWTEKRYEIAPTPQLRELLRSFADSMTGFFHWCLERDLYDYLDPKPRQEAEGG